VNLDSPYLNLLKNRINMRQIPFSERASRLMVFRSNHHFTIKLAERWFKLQGQLAAYRERPPLIDQWSLTDGEGNPLEINLTTYPHRLDCATRVGTFSLTFVDPETLLLTLPSCPCGIKFDANLDHVHPDRRGGVLRLTGDIRRNVAYTTDARILKNDTISIDARNQSVQLLMDASEGNKSFLLNITPRLGFNRYIPNAADAIGLAARRWHDWFAAAPPVAD